MKRARFAWVSIVIFGIIGLFTFAVLAFFAFVTFLSVVIGGQASVESDHIVIVNDTDDRIMITPYATYWREGVTKSGCPDDECDVVIPKGESFEFYFSEAYLTHIELKNADGETTDYCAPEEREGFDVDESGISMEFLKKAWKFELYMEMVYWSQFIPDSEGKCKEE